MIVGLVGFIGSGKGTVGDLLVSHGFQRDSFAAPLKDAAAVIFGWSRHLLEGDTEQSRAFREIPDEFWSDVMGRSFTPREALQKMGTEAGRNVYHPDIWTRSLERRVAAVQASTNDKSNIVITDVRFGNEIKMIRRMGGRIIEVSRGKHPLWYLYANELNEDNNWDGNVQVMSEFPNVHYSEWAWIGSPEITDVLENNGTVEQLDDNLVDLLSL